MDIELKAIEKSDKKILSKFFCESSESPPGSVWQRYLLKLGFVRKWILRFFSNKILEDWDKLKFWLILADKKKAGFVLLTWRESIETDKRIAAVQDIYLRAEFLGKKIEEQVINSMIEFCDDKNLRLSFFADPEWHLWEK